MKPVAFNLKNAKKVSGDKVSSTFELKGGHKIRVAHAPLSVEHRKAVSEMPVYMDEGGEAHPNPTPTPPPQIAPAADNDPAPTSLPPPSGGASGSFDDDGSSGTDQAAQEQSLPDQGAPVVQQNAQGINPQGMINPAEALNQQLTGLKQQTEVEKQKSASDLQTEKNHLSALDTLKGKEQNALQEMNDNHLRFTNDIINNKINPNHYLQDASTGKKVRTAIGLFLGGFSSAFTGQGNPAMDFLNKQIDRDIEGQKMQLGKSRTLYEANLAHFRDQQMALNATKAQENEVYAHQILQSANALGTPAAIARGNMAAGALKRAAAGEVNQNAIRAAALQQNAEGGGGLKDPSILIPALVPPDKQKEAYKEIQDRQNSHHTESAILEAFDNAAKDNTVLRTGAGYLRTPESVLKLNALALPLIHDAEGRVNEFEAKTIHDLQPQPGDTDTKVAAKRVGYQQFMQGKRAAPVTKSFGIDLDRYPSTSYQSTAQDVQAQQFINYANKNAGSKDPAVQKRIQFIKQRYGGR